MINLAKFHIMTTFWSCHVIMNRNATMNMYDFVDTC